MNKTQVEIDLTLGSDWLRFTCTQTSIYGIVVTNFVGSFFHPLDRQQFLFCVVQIFSTQQSARVMESLIRIWAG